MKYKLINKTTGEEHICSKETVNDFDYYIGDVVTDIEHPHVWDKTETKFHPYLKFIGNTKFAIEGFEKGCFLKVIATNRHDVKIPKVIDEVEELAEKIIPDLPHKKYVKIGFIGGCNKSQETHPHSDDDAIEFSSFCFDAVFDSSGKFINKTNQDLLKIWKEQKIKTIYYDNK